MARAGSKKNNDTNINHTMKYHLIGVEGISMRGIKKLLRDKGHLVTGSDLKTTGHSKDNVSDDTDVVVRTSAVNPGSPGWVEVEAAKEKNIKVIKRSKMLGEITKDKKLIAISGMHGKTTVTSLIGLTLIEAGFDPTVLIGERISEFDDDVLRIGKSEYFVMEACEYDKSFLDFKPDIAIITNIDLEHLDTFPGGLPEIVKTYKKFTDNIKLNGSLILFNEDEKLKEIAKDVREDINIEFYDKHDICKGTKLSGDHNRANVGAAIKLTELLEINKEKFCKVVKSYVGPKRRLEYHGEVGSAIVYDDYGHHPTEIAATIQSLREKHPNRRLVVVFWPHQFKRVKPLLKEFAKSLEDADEVILKPIFFVPGRDEKLDVSSKDLSDLIVKVKSSVIKKDEEIEQYLRNKSSENIVILTTGIPKINKIAESLVGEQS